jgi:TPR repeat protein
MANKSAHCRFVEAVNNLYSSSPEAHIRAAQALTSLAEPLVQASDIYMLENMDEDRLTIMGHAAFWLATLSASGLFPHAVPENGSEALLLLQAAADVHSIQAHLALAFRYETGFSVDKSCDLAYSHLKVMLCAGVLCWNAPPWNVL